MTTAAGKRNLIDIAAGKPPGEPSTIAIDAAPAALTGAATESQNSSALTVTHAINTLTDPTGSGLDATGVGKIDALFAEVKVDLDANKVVVDQLVVESTDYKVAIDANVVDVAAQKVELDKLIVEYALLRTVLVDHGFVS